MRAPLSWLREFTPVEAEPRAIAEVFDQLGFEVEAISEPGRDIGGVVAARVVAVRPHPDADRLRLVEVAYGLGETTVVCGAPNLTEGMVVAFAGEGSTLPGGITLEARKIRGVTSDGMLCSPAELGLGEDHDGILELDAEAEIGVDVVEVLGLDDVVFDLAITPNRPDAMGIIGLARELAAHYGIPCTIPDPDETTASGVDDRGAGIDAAISVTIEAPDRCPRYLARVVSVVMGESPAWMARRLTLAGMRPISNVVDVTNYVLLERNQPLHAFDLDRLAGRGIVVRLAHDGERIETLDRVERTLTSGDLMICDADRGPQALAGIMGSGDSEVSETTTTILVEAAYFDPMGIARTSKRLGLRSESSHRFERGIDPDAVATAAARAVALLGEVADGHASPEVIDDYPRPHQRPHITVRTARVGALLGVALTPREVTDALTPLGIDVTGDGPDFDAVPPSWRPDLEREIDLVEEVARRIGLDSIPRTLPNVTGERRGLTPRQRDRRLVADLLVGLGLFEAVSVPLIAPGDVERLGLGTDGLVHAVNSLRVDESVLRPAILPGLVAAVARNTAYGRPDVALFEMGHVFAAPNTGDLLPDEPDHIAVVLAGLVHRRPIEPDRPVDVYDVTDVVTALGEGLGLAALEVTSADVVGFVSGRSAIVTVDGSEIGRVGELPSDLGDGDGPLVALELDLDALLDGTRRDRDFQSPSRFPASHIDLAFVLDESVTAGAVIDTLTAAGGDLVESVTVFDEFRGDAAGPGRRSLAFRLHYRAADRTLTDTDVAQLRGRAIKAVTSAHHGDLRG